MPAFELMDRNDDAVLWRRRQGADAEGQAIVDPPEEIRVRWIWQDTEVPAEGGGTVVINATLVVDRDIPVGSILFEGTLEDWEAAALGTGTSAEEVEGGTPLCVVAWRSRIPAIKGRQVGGRKLAFRQVGLQRYGNELPEVGA